MQIFFKTNWTEKTEKNQVKSCDGDILFSIPHDRKFPIGRIVDVMKPKTFINFRPYEETVFILHGYNGSAHEKYIRYLKDGE